ncbi:MAG: hypothetical protein Q8K60_00305 [Parachlamydiaceae bacterium]|nr:hypothetical protein [Parachlamydiaceae bacterium]
MASEIFHVGKWCCETIISGAFSHSSVETKQKVLLARICVVAMMALSFLIVDATRSLFFDTKIEFLLKGLLAVICYDGIIMIGECGKLIEKNNRFFLNFFPIFQKRVDLETIIKHTILNKAYRWVFINVGNFQ